jgi:hypothetical protein
MFSVITNIYNKKTKGPTLMELFTATGKLKKFFLWQLEMFDVCTTGDTAHIDTIFKFLPHTLQDGCIDILHCCTDPCRARMVLSVGGSFVYFARNALCTVTADLLVWYPNTQNDFSPEAAIFSLQTLASPSGRNVNYDEKQFTGKNNFELFLPSVQFRKYMSYGFPVMNFCNSGIDYGTPCVMFTIHVLSQKVSKLPITSTDQCYIVTKTTASMNNP